MFKRIQDYAALLVVVGAVVAGLKFFAWSADLKLVEMRLDQKIIYDQMNMTQNRIDRLEDKYRGTPCVNWNDVEDKEKYRELKRRERNLEKKLDYYMKRTGG